MNVHSPSIHQPIRVLSSWSTGTDLTESGMVPSTPTERKISSHHLDAFRKGHPQVGELSGGAVEILQKSWAQNTQECYNLGFRYYRHFCGLAIWTSLPCLAQLCFSHLLHCQCMGVNRKQKGKTLEVLKKMEYTLFA